MTRALVTAGGTREPIDGVRFITNFSSGTTGAALADAFAAAGWEVTLVRARDAVRPVASAVVQVPYSSVADLDDACRVALGKRAYDVVVHAAAVRDFVVGAVVVDGARHVAPLAGKLDSAHGLSVELVPSPKILPRLRGYSRNAAVAVVGFKLTNGATADEAGAAVRRQFETARVDAVVHNDLTEMDHARDRHVTTLWIAGEPVAQASSNAELAALLVRLVGERVSASGA